MASDFQDKTTKFNTLAFGIRTENREFFRGKTLSKMFKITTNDEKKPVILFPKSNLPEDIKENLTAAFDKAFASN
ncbi:MAG: hypothetical protein EOO45_16820 [Flavobacterium sp.]|nr:MAG: hypothetical protein EOO45_16820 [Flavobacterium sp.]